MGYSASRLNRTYPGILGLQYSPVGLWVFNGDYTDSSATAATLNVARGASDFVHARSTDDQSLVLDDPDGIEAVTKPSPAALRVAGDVTVQLIYTPIKGDIGTFGSVLCACDGQTGVAADNVLYMLLLSDTAGTLNPVFRWEHGAGLVVDVTYSGFNMVPGLPHHIVGRRWDAGAGSITGELWVDGVLVISNTGLVAADGGANSYLYLGRQGSGFVAVQQSIYHCMKVVDRKLTDSELMDEFRRSGLGGF